MRQSPLIPELRVEELPDKPSELLELALNDFLEVTAQKDKYIGDMNVWYDVSGKCKVCLAGAIFAKRSTISKKMVIDTREEHFDGYSEDCQYDATVDWEGFEPAYFDQISANKFHAINAMRMGHVSSAFTSLGLRKQDGEKFNRCIENYNSTPREFIKNIQTLINDLKSGGF